MRNLSKQSFLGKNLEEILSTKTIGLIGLNGGGSHLVQQLSNIGFKNFVIADPGTMDEKKLNRNVLASISHAERNIHKVDVAIERIKSLNKEAKITSIKDKWQIGAERGDFDPCDVIMAAVDTFSERDQIERFTRRLEIPNIDIGMDILKLKNGRHAIFGQAIMTFPNGPCLRCLGLLTEKNLKRERDDYGDAGDRPQVVWPNGILASTAISFLMDYFFNWSGNHPDYLYREYDGNSFTLKDSQNAIHLTKNLKNGCEHFL